MSKQNMKYVIGILFITFQFQTFAQKTEMEKKISELFFGLNLNQKPSEIVQESDLEFDYNEEQNLSEQYRYSAVFKEHPKLGGQIKNGTFEIDFDSSRENQGIFQLTLTISFDNKTESIKAYEKIKLEFINFAGKETTENISNSQYGFDSKSIVYYKHENYEIPRLTFSYMNIINKDPVIIIEFLNSWILKKIKEQ